MIGKVTGLQLTQNRNNKQYISEGVQGLPDGAQLSFGAMRHFLDAPQLVKVSQLEKDVPLPVEFNTISDYLERVVNGDFVVKVKRTLKKKNEIILKSISDRSTLTKKLRIKDKDGYVIEKGDVIEVITEDKRETIEIFPENMSQKTEDIYNSLCEAIDSEYLVNFLQNPLKLLSKGKFKFNKPEVETGTNHLFTEKNGYQIILGKDDKSLTLIPSKGEKIFLSINSDINTNVKTALDTLIKALHKITPKKEVAKGEDSTVITQRRFNNLSHLFSQIFR